ncbi:MAG: class I SAM-dependent methyltransferase [Flavobacteriaceae bacterium]|nr:class I SAM-dependent methyltransferase [Flavobacteriaceae bacterium]
MTKIIRRFKKKSYNKTKMKLWMDENKISLEGFLKNIDYDLWVESTMVNNEIKNHSKKILKSIEVKLGGGGCHLLIYFLVRYLKPKIILETGVAAGFSSLSILKAIEKNKRGKLYSSDFPYFRIKNPEKYIGILVDKEKYLNWRLEIEGDAINIPKFKSEFNKIDLFHYDSDKTYQGKKNILKLIKNRLSINSTLIFDDIQDDIFFYELVSKSNLNSKIFKIGNKYVGLLGDFQK